MDGEDVPPLLPGVPPYHQGVSEQPTRSEASRRQDRQFPLPEFPRLLSWHSSTRKTPEARKRLAENELTREYLEAGLRLIAAQLHGPPIEADSIGEPSPPSPFFDWLSEQKVIDEVTRAGRERGSQGTFEDRWRYRDFYIEDLLVYAMWEQHWSSRIDVAERAATPLTTSADLVQAVHEAAYHELDTVLNATSARIGLIAIAISDRYPEMKTAMQKVHRMMDGRWMPIIEAMLAERGLKLRPGVTLEMLIAIFTALMAGLSMRIFIDQNEDFIDEEHRQSLFGEAALMMLAGCIDSGNEKSVAETIADLTRLAAQDPAGLQADLPRSWGRDG
jgi:hypothetical protein